MNELLQHIIANGFADFQGANIVADVPVRQETINELLAAFLRDGLPAKLPSPENPTENVTAPESAVPPAKPILDAKAMLKLVKTATVTADQGRLWLHVEVKV